MSEINQEDIMRCVVPDCNSVGDEIPMFSFPKSPVLNRRWRLNVFRPDLKDFKNAKVCLRHFAKTCCFRHSGKTHLIESAAPTLRLPSDSYRKEKMKPYRGPKTEKAVVIDSFVNMDKVDSKIQYCCICKFRFNLKSMSTVYHNNKWTRTGRKMLYLITAANTAPLPSPYLCHKCRVRVDNCMNEYVRLQEMYLHSVVGVSDNDSFEPFCLSCGKPSPSHLSNLDHMTDHFLEATKLCTDIKPPAASSGKGILKATKPRIITAEEEAAWEKEREKCPRPRRSRAKRRRDEYEEEERGPDEEEEERERDGSVERWQKTQECLKTRICCVCDRLIKEGQPYESVYKENGDSNDPSQIGSIFLILFFAPEQSKTNYLCGSCTEWTMSIFQDVVSLNLQYVLTCRRPNGESLMKAIGLGCLKADCPYVAQNQHEMATHIIEHAAFW